MKQVHTNEPSVDDLYLKKYTHLSNALRELLPTIQFLKEKTTTNNADFELETRLGKIIASKNNKSKFESHVSRDIFKNSLHSLENYKDWYCVSDMKESHVYYYHVDLLGEVRTEVFFDERGKTTKHMQKTLIDKKTFIMDTTNEIQLKDTWDIRVSLSKEKPLMDGDVPPIVNTTQVRIRQRKSFYSSTKNTGYDKPIWRFDYTMVWSGNNFENAEIQQRTCPPKYQIECELLEPSFVLSTNGVMSCCVEILLKTLDLIELNDDYILTTIAS